MRVNNYAIFFLIMQMRKKDTIFNSRDLEQSTEKKYDFFYFLK